MQKIKQEPIVFELVLTKRMLLLPEFFVKVGLESNAESSELNSCIGSMCVVPLYIPLQATVAKKTSFGSPHAKPNLFTFSFVSTPSKVPLPSRRPHTRSQRYHQPLYLHRSLRMSPYTVCTVFDSY